MSKTNLQWVLAAVCVGLGCFGCTSTNDPESSPAVDAGAAAKKADAGREGGGSVVVGEDSGTSTEDAAVGPEPCTPISGGLPCEPGKIYCGSASCDQATEECCVNTKTGSAACGAKGSCGTKAALGCDEAADCASGEICCFSASGITPTGALCQTGPCTLGGYSQTCRTDEECAGGSCSAGSCAGYTIQTCAPIPATACGN